MKDSKNNIVILNFDAHKTPTFKEVKSKEWVIYSTDKKYYNRYPDFLVSLYNESPTHNAIINGKVKYVVGQGWLINDKNLSTQQRVDVHSWVNNVGEDSLFDLTNKVAKDRELFGGFCIRPVWSKDKSTLYLYHIDFSKIRVSADGEQYFYTSDWSKRNPQDNDDFQVFTPFNPNKKEKNTLIYYKDYRPNIKHYPLPSYQAGINYISADIDISKFVASNTSNGFNGGTLINLYNGEPVEEEKKKIERKFKEKFTGAENAGALVISFNSRDTKGAEILPLNDNGQDDRFVSLNQQVREAIFTSHGATNPVLFGVKASNGMGNNADEIRTASEYLQNAYITPQQRVFIDLFNEITALNGWGKPLEIQKLEVIKAQLSENTLLQILDVNEMRELAGFPPLKTDNKSDFARQEGFYNAMRATGYTDDELEEVVSERFLKYNPFDFVLTDIDNQILGLIIGKPNVTVADLQELTGYHQDEIQATLDKLIGEGMISDNNGTFTPTKQDNNLITVYKYALRQDAPPLKTESRQFCQTLIGIGRNYTREQIKMLSNEFGTDVWQNRGGWYHNPNTGKNTPFCRHIWKARTVKLKNK